MTVKNSLRLIVTAIGSTGCGAKYGDALLALALGLLMGEVNET
jgi:hypothetical protein